MHRLTLSAVIMVSALGVGVPPAAAANPEVNHFTFTDSFTDTDFCGLGATVEISTEVHGTEFFAPNQPVEYWNTSVGNTVLTNPATGETVVIHSTGTFSDTTLSGDPEGIHTHEFTYTGLPELVRTEHGAVLIRDAGYLVFHDTFDGDEFISGEIAVDRGPHPDAESDFELFCEVVPDALGLG